MENPILNPDKNSQQSSSKKELLHTDKGIYEVPIANIMLNGEKLSPYK